MQQYLITLKIQNNIIVNNVVVFFSCPLLSQTFSACEFMVMMWPRREINPDKIIVTGRGNKSTPIVLGSHFAHNTRNRSYAHFLCTPFTKYFVRQHLPGECLGKLELLFPQI